MSTLSTGSKGAEVTILQRSLSFLGYTVTIDGDFGNGTKAAVVKFQTGHSLQPDGEVGANTWAKLDYLVPQGMDISHYNNIDFNNLPPHLQFVYCKASQGATYKDPAFKGYISSLKQKNIISGPYHFLTFQTSAQSQVDNLIACGFDFSAPGTLPLAVDVEEQVGSSDAETKALNQYILNNKTACIKLVSDFLALAAEKTGRTPVVYTYRSFMSEYLNNTTAFANYPLWIASYQAQKPGLPPGWNKYGIWQYFGAPDSPAKGIADLDLFNGTSDDLKTFATPPAAVPLA